MHWFKHDTDANADNKLQNVLLDYGLEGYGLYWYCIELIAGRVDKDKFTFELEHDARIIARNTGSTPQKVEEMMRYFVKVGLFENSDGVITCLKLAKRLDKSMTSNPEMRRIIEQLKLRKENADIENHDSIMTKSDVSVIESEKIMQDKIRLDQIRESTMSSGDDVDQQKEQPKAKSVTQINYQEFADAYNETFSGSLPACKVINAARQRGIKKIIGLLQSPTVEKFRAYLETFKATARPFYFGDNKTGWVADFDFMLQEKTLTKTREGTIASGSGDE